MNWGDFFYYKKDENSNKSFSKHGSGEQSGRKVFQESVIFYLQAEWDIQIFLIEGFAFSSCLDFIDNCYDNNMSVEHTCSKLMEWFWSIGFPRED